MAFGEFEPSQSSAPMSEINVTPLVDVMLVLLVIFIITAPLMTSALRMDLPSVEAPPAGNSPNVSVVVSLDSQGLLQMEGQPIALDQLATALDARAQAQPDTDLQLQADQQVPYGRVAEVMAEIQKSKLHSVSLAVQPPAPKIQASSPPLQP
jgi:biopolymer transport protein TolR